MNANIVRKLGVCCILVCGTGLFAAPQPTQTITGHVPAVVPLLQPVGAMPAETNLHLAIGLPLHNKSSLSNLLENLSDPASPNFRQWLSREDFTGRFGPTETEYEKVVEFAERHSLAVTERHANRMVVDVSGTAAQIEDAFKVHLRLYQHPTENRIFYAPDSEPQVDAGLPVLHIGGLDNYILPKPLLKLRLKSNDTNQPIVAYSTGSGPGGDFTGMDFRHAYAPNVTNTGAGQYIAIVDVGGPYYTYDVYRYESNAGFSTNIVVTNILLSGWTGIPTTTNEDDGEESLDIDMSLSMAPGATILNYEGGADDVFNRIASDNLAKQITMSYGFGIDETIVQDYMEFVAQGQAFFQASGDGGADLPGGTGLTGMPYSTIVGGTSLTTLSGGGAWVSESSWTGSGGGISGYGIPTWQEGINMSTNLGSTINRNYPDVAMLADVVIWWYFMNGVGATVGGTSASSPQWAGFMALVNQSAASQGKPSVGFLCPAVYGIGKGPYSTYTNTMHDIITGNNFNSHNPSHFAATAGYDLCTGWGSPMGSNTISALVGLGTNSFLLNSSSAGFTLVKGCVGTAVIQVTPMDGFSGSVSLSISGLPAGVSGALTATSVTTNASVLTLTVASSAATGASSPVITATSGSITRSLTLSLNVTQPIPGATQVSLASYFNRAGIYTDGSTFGSGLDNDGSAFSANLLGPRPSLRNIPFTLGSANANDAVICSGQTVTLPAGQYTTLQLAANGLNGNQASQTFTVTYTDNSTTVITQSISDWFTPQGYPQESVLNPTPYRNQSNGTKDYATFRLYDYTLALNPAKTVKSIALPSNSNLAILAMTLVSAPTPVTLSSFYNRAGMYTDGTSFTNPATGGADGGGNAYSATLLGGSQVWNGVQFDFGPANVSNIISCSNEVIPLPAGNFRALDMLASGVQGSQTSQTFKVTYTDSTSTTFTQSLSDWYTPQNFSGESEAVLMGYRNLSTGTMDNRTFYLYGYSFTLAAGKTTQSLTLPNNGNVIIAAVSMVPNLPPVWLVNPFTETAAMAGQVYSGTVATNASDFYGNTISYAVVSGPSWLSLAGNGALSGTPLSSADGANSFVVSATDPGGLSNTATMNITVSAAPVIIAGISEQGTNLLLTWTGGIAPYQIQMTTNLPASNWVAVATGVTSNSLAIAPTNTTAFYQILGE